jgi:hypothetical protein
MTERDDPKREGHTKEWQDRARVVLDAKKDAQADSVDKQSPVNDEGKNDDNPEKEDKKDRSNDAVY